MSGGVGRRFRSRSSHRRSTARTGARPKTASWRTAAQAGISWALSSLLLAARSREGTAASGGETRGGGGANGLRSDSDSDVHALSCTFAGGQSGSRTPAGSPGPDLVALGSFENLRGSPRPYQVAPHTVVAGSTATLTASGLPGDLVVSIVGLGATNTYLPQHLGTQLVAPPAPVHHRGHDPHRRNARQGDHVARAPASRRVRPGLPPRLLLRLHRRGFLSSATAVIILGTE